MAFGFRGNHPANSALSKTRQNSAYAKLGMIGTSPEPPDRQAKTDCQIPGKSFVAVQSFSELFKPLHRGR
jgi:hypothetical protein